jgi:multiple sugar transport system ATP-binding protein
MPSASLTLNAVTKQFGLTRVLDSVDCAIEAGEFCVIVGASGCGKSTLLRSIAGLEEIDSGEIRIGDRRVDGLPPAERGIAMVFQSYALYPHLTVFENMAFALRLAKRPDGEVRERVAKAAKILALEDFLDRKPAALSGGQRQRVAIGRAIVREPSVFLFDEPLSNLDASLRNRMRFEFATLHKALGTTTVYVTHDQVEAMTLADRIIVMRDGRIEQAGTPDELYNRPANLFVAGFLGSPQMNFLKGNIEIEGSGQALAIDGGRRLPLPPVADRLVGKPVTLGVRPEHWRVGEGGLAMTARFIERLGSSANVHLDTGDGAAPLIWHRQEPVGVSEGETVTLTPDPSHLYLFDSDGSAILQH